VHECVDEIILNNPYPVEEYFFDMPFFLGIINNWLLPEGKLTINGTLNNKYFNIFNKKRFQEEINTYGFMFNGLPIQPLHSKFRNHKHFQSNLQTEIQSEYMKTTVLKNLRGQKK